MLRLTLVGTVLSCLALPALAQSPVNVKDFGAKGDGQTDDTAAIQAAIASVRGISEPYPGTAYYTEMQPVVFPVGKYRISDALRIGNGSLRGEGAVIEQSDPAKDIFETDYAWRMTIQGFTFLGGRNQLVLHNPNLDTGQIQIEKCRFYGARGVALDVDIVSTTLLVRDCIFLACRQVWINRGCDQAAMRDCWITTDSEMRNMAAIEHRGGRLTIENLCGVPLVNGSDQRWIDNYGANLTCRQARFGGEGGGFTPVVNYAKYSVPFGATVLLDDCFVCANGNSRRNCAVYCEELPNQLHIRDCQLAGAALVGLREGIDLRRYFVADSADVFSFVASGNAGPGVGELPKLLLRPRVTPPPPKGMTDAQARAGLAEAIEQARPRAGEDATGGECNGHRQRADAGGFVDLSPESVQWSVDDMMDATQEKCAQHLAFAPVGTDVVVMRRTEAKDNWPHVTIGPVDIDLDRYPFLTWKQKPTGSAAPGTYAVRVLDVASGTELLLEEGWSAPWDGYRAFNLRELLKAGGTRSLRIRYYHLGVRPVEKGAEYAKPGDCIVLDFVRAEGK